MRYGDEDRVCATHEQNVEQAYAAGHELDVGGDGVEVGEVKARSASADVWARTVVPGVEVPQGDYWYGDG